MRTVQTIVVIAWIAGIGWAADTRPAPAHQREAASKAAPTKAAAKPAGPVMSDAQIEAAIRAKFAKSKINAEKFQVHVQGGVATIEGRTDVVQHKGTATRMARTAGAVAVNNHIRVSDAAKQKSAANLEEGRRRAQIKRGDARSDPRQPATSR
jgi:osmotically-inducible protein OsmY